MKNFRLTFQNQEKNGTEISDRYKCAYRRSNESSAKGNLSFLAKIINKNFTISFVTKIEFLGYKDVPKSSEEFISLASVIGVDESIIEMCISLRKNHKIKLPDAILAATALVYKLTLITRNISDFKDIKDLKVIDLYNI